MTRRDRHQLLWLGLASCLCLIAELTGLLPAPLGYVAPVLILALPLLARRYPGEDLILRLGRPRRHVARRRAPVLPAPLGARVVQVLPRGGRLIAAALAVRPPPAALVTR